MPIHGYIQNPVSVLVLPGLTVRVVVLNPPLVSIAKMPYENYRLFVSNGFLDSSLYVPSAFVFFLDKGYLYQEIC